MARFKRLAERDSDLDLGVLLAALTAFQHGDFSVRMPNNWIGMPGKIADKLNEITDAAERTVSDFDRISQVVGKAGKTDARLMGADLLGSWAKLADSSNTLIEDLVSPLNEIVRVIGAISNGDLSLRVPMEIDGRKIEGQFLKSAQIVNVMVGQLSAFSAEIIRVAHEVGMDGKLGGQANVPGVAGTWRDLTDNVNSMATNLTTQVRGIAQVVTAVANGDLSKKVTVDVKGEIADLAGTINSMTETLALFADQVTRVAREVGMDGKLGGQANVPGVAGTWRDLTDNVNSMATNLTDQVRAIAGVATAVTKGDLTRSVTAEAKGEVAELKDNVNEMIRNLRETTNLNLEQDWLKTNLAKFTRILQGQRDHVTVSKAVLSDLVPLVNAHYGAFYIMQEPARGEARLKMLSAYANREGKNLAKVWKLGEGLVGQCAYEKQRILLTDVPSDYIEITSGLGQAKPLNILLLPIIFKGKVKAVIELASFKEFSATHQTFLDQLAESIGIVLNIIEADMRTDELLKQSQSLANELQSQQEELRQTNDELGDKALLLEEQKMEVEAKNYEVGQAKAAVEEKALQLALTSKYKSEFLSNMSHELRTPLNSLLILAEHLATNQQDHLDAKEVQFAKLIETSGNDLLSLINEILDLSKIESGTVSLDFSRTPFALVRDQIDQTFRHVAKDRGLDFDVTLASDLPLAIITDEMRLLQVMKNLLSNAFKFTEKGYVSVHVDRALSGWSAEIESLNKADEVFAFTVEDSGIGISADKQRIIFEAFQQGDGRTARKYGGTGLGLSISRGITHLLGGELTLARSKPKEGSVFVLYIPNGSANRLTESTLESEPSTPSKKPFHPPALNSAVESGIRRGVVQSTDNLRGKKVLIVDDDTRNIIALTAGLERKGIVVSSVESGRSAIDILKKTPDLDLVLMDIMMPDMDGYQTMRKIRKLVKFKKLPIIALTAKAMVGDREKCIEAGASDYLSKPANIEQIASLMQVWLAK